MMLGVLHACMGAVCLCSLKYVNICYICFREPPPSLGLKEVGGINASQTVKKFPESIQKMTCIHAQLKGAAHDIIAFDYYLCDPIAVSAACCSSSCYADRAVPTRVLACAL